MVRRLRNRWPANGKRRADQRTDGPDVQRCLGVQPDLVRDRGHVTAGRLPTVAQWRQAAGDRPPGPPVAAYRAERRHVLVQLAGDKAGSPRHLGQHLFRDRPSLQRNAAGPVAAAAPAASHQAGATRRRRRQDMVSVPGRRGTRDLGEVARHAAHSGIRFRRAHWLLADQSDEREHRVEQGRRALRRGAVRQ